MQNLHRLRRLAALLLPAAFGVAVSPGVLAAQTQGANIQSVVTLSSTDVEKAPGGVRGDLILARDGHIYFTSTAGGDGIGAISKLEADGTLSVLYSMSEYAQGATPYAKLMQGSDDHLYGTTYLGGDRGVGVLFRVTLGGEHTVLHSFDNRAPAPFLPYTGVLEGPDGYLYGTTLRGGTNDMGTVYRISRTGTEFAVIHHFNGDNGRNPEGTLVAGADGLLYGTTLQGGSSNRGVIYRISTDGSIERLYSFPALAAFTSNPLAGATNSTGANPRAGLLRASDGNFYGTAYQGGANGFGTVFRMTPDGVVSTFHDFTGPSLGGGYPLAGVIEGPGGALYGTSEGGGYLNAGSAWRIDAGGNFTLLHGFLGTGIDGRTPHAGLLFAHDSLYGVSFTDDIRGRGAIFKLLQGTAGVLPVELTISATEITAGQNVSLTWNAPGATVCAKFGDWTGEVSASGGDSFTLLNARTYTYTLRCTFAEDVVRNAYAAVVVKAPPLQPVDGGGGAGALSLLPLLLLAALLTRKFIKETACPCP